MERLPPTRNCFVCGTDNPIGLKLDLFAGPEVVETRFQFRRDCCGFRDTVHGGLIATVLDEIMVWAVGNATKQFGYCAEMTVRFLRPTAAGIPLVASGRLTENRRGRLFLAEGEIRDTTGTVLATATGKYMPIPGELRAGILSDFVEPPAGF